MVQFLKELIHDFAKSDTFQKGAALSYYAVFSILPIIIIITSLLGLLYGDQAISGEIYEKLKDIFGTTTANQIEVFIKDQHYQKNNVFKTIIGFIVLAFTASEFFVQIQIALNQIWNVKPLAKHGFLTSLFKRFMSFMVLSAVFLIMITGTIINGYLDNYSPEFTVGISVVRLSENILSLFSMSVVFALMFKYLGDAVIAWKVAFAAGVLTSFLYLISKMAIGKYLEYSDLSSTFGSASVLAVIMMWVYYISQTIFFGACFIKVLSKRLGYGLTPND